MTLYELIGDLRREHPTPSASRTLDLVTAELGRTRDNLRQAVTNLVERPLPAGGKTILDDLLARAEREGVDENDSGPVPGEQPPVEPLDEATAGIGVVMGGTALIGLALLVTVLVIGFNKAFHFLG
jgi:hypothetical protein